MANWGRIGSRGKVEDRRSMAPVAVGGLSITGLAVLMLFNVLTGGDAADVLSQLEQIPVAEQPYPGQDEFSGNDSYEEFAAAVLGSNNDMWRNIFSQLGQSYEEPRLVLFRTVTQSGCGSATSQVGPHYCPIDRTIYLDETFFEELTSRFGAAGGDVAEAYVIAHEVGHHAQFALGLLDVYEERSQTDSIRQELQADCFAGLWAHSIRNQQIFEPGEIREAMDAAAAVGDDRIQSRVTGQVSPETWTHGSSDERVAWFTKGYEEGRLGACETGQ